MYYMLIFILIYCTSGCAEQRTCEVNIIFIPPQLQIFYLNQLNNEMKVSSFPYFLRSKNLEVT